MLAPKSSEATSALSFLPNTSTAGTSTTSTPEAQVTPTNETPIAASTEDASTSTGTGDSQTIIQNLTAHLDQLPDPDKKFLAEHLTPEFVRAIGLINGPEVAQYLNQFVDPNKVMVPVPRQIAEQYLAQQQATQGQSAPQGQPQPAPQGAPAMAPPSQPPMPQAPAGPQAGMMQSPM